MYVTMFNKTNSGNYTSSIIITTTVGKDSESDAKSTYPSKILPSQNMGAEVTATKNF